MSSRGSAGNSADGTRQARREDKLRKKKAAMKVHGKGVGKVYEDAVRKRTNKS